MSIPQFDKFGVNTYRHKIIQRNGLVTISPRTWLAAIFFFLVGIGVGSFAVSVIISRGKIVLSGGMLAAYAGTVISIVIGILYALYKEEITFDFHAKNYQIKKGLLWKVKTVQGTFEDIEAVIVREARVSSGGNKVSSQVLYNIELKCRTESPTFDIWQTSTKKQAEYISASLAHAFGCELRFRKQPGS